jgi:hypothetical protein
MKGSDCGLGGLPVEYDISKINIIAVLLVPFNILIAEVFHSSV